MVNSSVISLRELSDRYCFVGDNDHKEGAHDFSSTETCVEDAATDAEECYRFLETHG